MTSAMIFLRLGPRAAAATGILLAAVGLARAAAAPGGDLLVTAAKPDRLFIIDAATAQRTRGASGAGADGGYPPS